MPVGSGAPWGWSFPSTFAVPCVLRWLYTFAGPAAVCGGALPRLIAVLRLSLSDRWVVAWATNVGGPRFSHRVSVQMKKRPQHTFLDFKNFAGASCYTRFCRHGSHLNHVHALRRVIPGLVVGGRRFSCWRDLACRGDDDTTRRLPQPLATATACRTRWTYRRGQLSHYPFLRLGVDPGGPPGRFFPRSLDCAGCFSARCSSAWKRKRKCLRWSVPGGALPGCLPLSGRAADNRLSLPRSKLKSRGCIFLFCSIFCDLRIDPSVFAPGPFLCTWFNQKAVSIRFDWSNIFSVQIYLSIYLSSIFLYISIFQIFFYSNSILVSFNAGSFC